MTGMGGDGGNVGCRLHETISRFEFSIAVLAAMGKAFHKQRAGFQDSQDPDPPRRKARDAVGNQSRFLGCFSEFQQYARGRQDVIACPADTDLNGFIMYPLWVVRALPPLSDLSDDHHLAVVIGGQ